MNEQRNRQVGLPHTCWDTRTIEIGLHEDCDKQQDRIEVISKCKWTRGERSYRERKDDRCERESIEDRKGQQRRDKRAVRYQVLAAGNSRNIDRMLDFLHTKGKT